MTERQTEALERLNQGIQESRREVQQRTMNLAQEYFGDSAEMLKQNIRENRATLEGLPDQIPGGREEAFQAFFEELMDNYSSMEECISEAQQNVANLDTDQIRRQGEIEATDAARREARERGVDLTKVEGTGSDGRIIVSDVVEVAETMEEGSASEVAQGAQDAAGQAADQAGQVAGQAKDAAGGAAQQAQDTAGQATDQAGQAVQGVQDTVGGLTGGQQQGGGPLGGVTDQVGQAAQGVQDTAGQAAGQAQQATGQATDQAGQVAGQAQDAAGQAAQQGQQVAQQGQQAAQQAAGGGQQQPNATQAAQQKAQELGVDLNQVQGTGAEGRITVRDVTGASNQ
jgi:pyruvate/2-oxoglutarate dehydrogenase complex dihydrolipoamide acyltransferase (E2) component